MTTDWAARAARAVAQIDQLASAAANDTGIDDAIEAMTEQMAAVFLWMIRAGVSVPEAIGTVVGMAGSYAHAIASEIEKGGEK